MTISKKIYKKKKKIKKQADKYSKQCKRNKRAEQILLFRTGLMNKRNSFAF